MDKTELKTRKVSAFNLGCDKNRVDLEHVLYALKEYGFQIVDNIEDAEIIFVNTCAFIAPARKEAIDAILTAIHEKTHGRAEKVIVGGCLPQRNLEELRHALPEVDYFLDYKNNDKIVSVIEELYDVKPTKFAPTEHKRVLTNFPHYAYLKISDGCSNACAYCAIPRIRGRFRSTPIDALVKEAKELASSGVKELIIVAQDVTRYGVDIDTNLLELLKELVKIKGIEWIRLHYLYPELVTDELLDFIKNERKMCKYVDIPLQHIDDIVLKNMNRRTSEQQIIDLMDKLRTKYPEISIRSTFIVGFPGETRAQFKKLCNFLKKYKLDNVGFFPYFREPNTKAFFYKKQVPEFVKRKRLKKIADLQGDIALFNNMTRIGQVHKVIVDYYDEENKYFVARTEFCSPNVDFCVIIDSGVKVGEFYNVELTDLSELGYKGEVK